MNSYSMVEKNIVGGLKESTEDYDLLSVIKICLGNPDKSTGIIRLLSVLLSENIKADQKLKVLHEEYGIDTTSEFDKEVTEMCSLGESLAREHFAIGQKKGEAIGQRKGALTSSLKTAIKMIMTREPREKIIDYSGLAEPQLTELESKVACIAQSLKNGLPVKQVSDDYHISVELIQEIQKRLK